MGKVYFIADENEDVVGISEALKEKGYSVSHKIALVGELIQSPVLYQAQVITNAFVRDQDGKQVVENGVSLVKPAGTLVDVYADHKTFGGFVDRAVIVPLSFKVVQNVWMNVLKKVE